MYRHTFPRAGAVYVVAQDREPVSDTVRATVVAENPGRADDHRGDHDDEPENDEYGELICSTL
jgi:hypothetical protein